MKYNPNWLTRIVIIGSLIGLAVMMARTSRPANAATAPRPRFEVVYTEHMDIPDNKTPRYAQVFHDKEAGIEIVCFRDGAANDAALACVPTGRRW